jgi:hypothetical protein
MLTFVEPTRPPLAATPVSDSGWLFEQKFRMVSVMKNENVTIAFL